MANAITASKPPATKLYADVEAVLKVIDAFGRLLAEETAALRQSDFGAVDRLQAAKRALAKEYQLCVETLAGRKEDVARLDMKTRERLVTKRTGFTLILDENLRALEAAKDSAGRLVDKILTAARRAVTDDRQTHYSAKGQTQACRTSTLSLSVDQKL